MLTVSSRCVEVVVGLRFRFSDSVKRDVFFWTSAAVSELGKSCVQELPMIYFESSLFLLSVCRTSWLAAVSLPI